jgi:ribosomal protein S18 acetylase RimI-like enzyme
VARPHAGEVEAYFGGRLATPLEVLIAFDERGAAIGFVELSIRPYADGCETDHVAYLEGWYVEPQTRRRGVGRALVRAAEDWAAARGCTEFGSDALVDNDVSAMAHRAVGFTETEQLRLFRKVLQPAVARSVEARDQPFDVQRLEPSEAAACAAMMVSSQPWITLRLTREAAAAMLSDPVKEVYATRDAAGVSGFVVIDMRGLLRGYIQILCVRPDRRGRGIGAALVRWAEERIFRESPNVFICVSSFNDGARRLYERLGFEQVGQLPDFIVAGHAEVLLRKTRGPWADFPHARR